MRPMLAICVGALFVLWPREGIVGSYGTYTSSRKGYTIAKEISVGAMSNHAEEGNVYRRREQAIDARVRPLLPLVDAWVARVRGGRHAYGGWLGAID